MSLHVKLDDKELLKAFQFTEKARVELIPTAYRQALNKTIITVRKESTQEIRKEINLKARDVKRKLTLQKARGTDLRTLGASMTVNGRRLNMKLFVKGDSTPPKPDQTGIKVSKRKPLRVEYKKGRVKKYRKAFIQFGRGNNAVMFQRTGKERGPIAPVTAPGINRLFDKATFTKPIIRVADRSLRKTFDDAMQNQLRKAGAR